MRAGTVLIGLLVSVLGCVVAWRLLRSAPLPNAVSLGDAVRNEYQGGDGPMAAALDAAL